MSKKATTLQSMSAAADLTAAVSGGSVIPEANEVTTDRKKASPKKAKSRAGVTERPKKERKAKVAIAEEAPKPAKKRASAVKTKTISPESAPAAEPVVMEAEPISAEQTLHALDGVQQQEPVVEMAKEQPAFDPDHHRHEIASLAYQLWEMRGRPNGSDAEDWFRAEQEIRLRLTATR